MAKILAADDSWGGARWADVSSFLAERVEFVLLHEFAAADGFGWHVDATPNDVLDDKHRFLNVNVVLSDPGTTTAAPSRSARRTPAARRLARDDERARFWEFAGTEYARLCDGALFDVDECHWIMSQYLAERGEDAAARRRAQVVYRREPAEERARSVAFFTNRAKERRAGGDLRGAIEDLEFAIGVEPDPRLHFNLAFMILTAADATVTAARLDAADSALVSAELADSSGSASAASRRARRAAALADAVMPFASSRASLHAATGRIPRRAAALVSQVEARLKPSWRRRQASPKRRPRVAPGSSMLHRGTSAPSFVDYDVASPAARAYDLARFLTILLVNYVLKQVPLSRAYHWIRGQNTIKLYVIVGIMEVFDRLLCAFSQDALDSFYLTTRHATEWRRVLLFFGLVNVVVVSHSLLLYTHLTTLNVVVNASEDSALVALLVSNNFSEIKSAVFKKYNATNLFDIACSDVCERFKLLLFLCLLTLLSWSQVAGDAEERSSGLRVVAAQSAVVFGFEVVADWLKHAFVAKFNRLDASVFDAYAARLARDVVTGRSQGGLALDHTHAVTRRLGFAVLPLACVSLRYLSLASNWLRLSLDLGTAELAVILAGFAVLLFQLKLLSSICLAGLACGYGDAAAQPAAPRPNRARPSNSFDAEGLPGSPKPRPGTPRRRWRDAATLAPRPAAPRRRRAAQGDLRGAPAPAKGKGSGEAAVTAVFRGWGRGP
ncbi:hypothetical protein JL720_4070 [Aureococcus anophagefferens]|nr:hypothetical protein JL720_4070 [Aureococcus anophagefferens]